MPKNIVKNVNTQGVGFAPILLHYFKQCGIEEAIDENIQTDPRRKVLTHGEACIAMITGILFEVMQLYRICRFASETTALQVILPHIKPDQYFDDRLADTLDAVYNYGIGNLEMLIAREMISSLGSDKHWTSGLKRPKPPSMNSQASSTNTGLKPERPLIPLTGRYCRKTRQLISSLIRSKTSRWSPTKTSAEAGNPKTDRLKNRK